MGSDPGAALLELVTVVGPGLATSLSGPSPLFDGVRVAMLLLTDVSFAAVLRCEETCLQQQSSYWWCVCGCGLGQLQSYQRVECCVGRGSTFVSSEARD